MAAIVLVCPAACVRDASWRLEQPRATTQPADAKSAWTKALQSHVKQGKVRYFGLAQDRRGLEWYMAWLAEHGPDSMSEECSRPVDLLAYWLNADQACAIWAGVAYHRARQRVPSERRDRVRPQPPFAEATFRIDGRPMTLADMAARAWQLRPEDFRLAAALADGSATGPPLIGELFDSERLEQQLERQWQTVLSDPDLTRIDHTKRTLLILPAVYQRREAIVVCYEKTFGAGRANLHAALLGLADAKARRWLNRALGYTIAPLPVSRVLRQRCEPWDPDP